MEIIDLFFDFLKITAKSLILQGFIFVFLLDITLLWVYYRVNRSGKPK